MSLGAVPPGLEAAVQPVSKQPSSPATRSTTDAALLMSLLRRWCTYAAPSGSRYWCGSSARNRANGGQAATSCSRAVEVLLIEALRSTSGEDAPPGLVRGLADARLAPAMRQMHGQLARSWTVAESLRARALERRVERCDLGSEESWGKERVGVAANPLIFQWALQVSNLRPQPCEATAPGVSSAVVRGRHLCCFA